MTDSIIGIDFESFFVLWREISVDMNGLSVIFLSFKAFNPASKSSVIFLSISKVLSWSSWSLTSYWLTPSLVHAQLVQLVWKFPIDLIIDLERVCFSNIHAKESHLNIRFRHLFKEFKFFYWEINRVFLLKGIEFVFLKNCSGTPSVDKKDRKSPKIHEIKEKCFLM